MHRVYELFEVLPNGVPQKMTVATGLELAKSRLQALAKQTLNECFAADAKTRQIVAQMNVPPVKRRAIKRILIVSYDEQLGLRRAALLKSYGYDAVSIIGNEAAKVLLTPTEHYDLFILGHAAPEETRQEMVAWLKEKYPRVKVLALNPPDQTVPGADYNVQQNGPEAWLPIVSQELGNSADGPDKASSGAREVEAGCEMGLSLRRGWPKRK
ncbi:MAG: hypothetical protein DMG40_20150 [Acidobacteria bacterium]|nr:MAG: hypothetical protein DMG40_20150 [Acidobacteriota bacterium]